MEVTCEVVSFLLGGQVFAQGCNGRERSPVLVDRHRRRVHVLAKQFFGLTPKVTEASAMPNEELRTIGRLCLTVVKPYTEVASCRARYCGVYYDSEPFDTVNIFDYAPDMRPHVPHVASAVERRECGVVPKRCGVVRRTGDREVCFVMRCGRVTFL